MTDGTVVENLCVAFVFITVINAITVYSVVKLLTLGKPLLRHKDEN